MVNSLLNQNYFCNILQSKIDMQNSVQVIKKIPIA